MALPRHPQVAEWLTELDDMTRAEVDEALGYLAAYLQRLTPEQQRAVNEDLECIIRFARQQHWLRRADQRGDGDPAAAPRPRPGHAWLHGCRVARC